MPRCDDSCTISKDGNFVHLSQMFQPPCLTKISQQFLLPGAVGKTEGKALSASRNRWSQRTCQETSIASENSSRSNGTQNGNAGKDTLLRSQKGKKNRTSGITISQRLTLESDFSSQALHLFFIYNIHL